MTGEDRAALQRLIEERIAEVEAEDARARDAREDITLDQQSVGRLSRMDAIQRKAMAEAAAGRRRVDLARLRAALGRVDDEEFGFCTDCGEEIPLARLHVDPALIRCAECTRGA